MSKTINLGPVTAYADAVAAGYTGTREQFAQDLANAANYAAESHANAEAASDAAETATTAASAASLDADAAHDDAATAHADAEAALSFKTAAETAATTATTKSGEAANSASQAATSASGAAGSATAASGSATAAAGSATNAAASETAAAGSATSAAGSASAAAQTLVDVNAAGATQIAAIGAKGEEVLESIPSDYTELSNDVSELKSDVGDLDDLETTDKSSLVAAINEAASTGSGLSDGIKQALLVCFQKVAWIDGNGQTYYDALEAAMYPPANLVRISAVYVQSGTVDVTDTLNTLKSDLTVTAIYSNGTTSIITNYTLSGSLTVGVSVITVNYADKTTTFEVIVSNSRALPSEYQEVEWIGVQNSTRATTAYLNIGNSVVPSNGYVIAEIKPFAVTGESAALGYYTDGAWEVYYNGSETEIKVYSSGGSGARLDNATIGTWDTVKVVGFAKNCGLYILAYRAPHGNYSYNGKVKSVQVYDSDDQLLYDFIPCYRISDDVIGMYDIINDAFYTNSGTGSLVKGDNV